MNSRLLKRIGAVVLSAVMAFSVIGAVFADGETTGETGRITFENSEKVQPDLYVYKTVSSVIGGYTIPDDEFTFILKWDQEGYMDFADSASYFLYENNGTQIWNENTSDGSFKTTSTGRFTMKNGQFVCFEWVGEGINYEITELTQDGYIQVLPENEEPATGTVSEEGSQVYFENLYIPKDETDYTQLIVRKDVLWPSGYQVLDDYTSPDFTFQVNIDGEIYSNKLYTVYDADDTDFVTALDTGRTDWNGQFSIRGGQQAVFDDIECGLDYQITEIADDADDLVSWQIAGTTEYHGSTSGPVVFAYFTNEPTWFTVGKQIYDGSTTEQEFTFTLTSTFGNVPYYLYDENGNLIADESESYIYYTDASGKFALKAGQTALFVELSEGMNYTLTETITDTNYAVHKITQNGETVESTDNTVSGTISFDGDEYVFVNEQKTNITIKKYDVETKDLLGNAEFTLYRLTDSAEDRWEQIGNPMTTNNDKTYKCTDCGETFSTVAEFDTHNTLVHNGEAEYEIIYNANYGTLIFTGITAGTYKIKETQTPPGYAALDDPIIVTIPYACEDEPTDDTIRYTYSERDGVYYVYDLIYEVDNEASLTLYELPNTGVFPWQWVALGVVLATTVGMAILYVRKNRKESEATEA